MGATAERLADVFGQCADVGALAATHVDHQAGILPVDDVDAVNRHAAGCALDLLGEVRDLVVTHHSQVQVAAALGSQGFLAQDMIPLAKTYDSKRRLQCRGILARTDTALRSGLGYEALVALTAMW